MIKRILVATDQTATASKAVEWAAEMSQRFSAELLLLQVVLPESLVTTRAEETAAATPKLSALARRLAGERGKARVVFDSDPSAAIVRAAAESDADVVVVGNVGMSGRKEFLLGSVPNRVSHNARCTVVIVNTDPDDGGRDMATAPEREPGTATAADLPAGRLLGRATHIGRVMARHGVRRVLDRSGGEEAQRAQARQLRDALEELGPTFAKLGQILSTRPDLVPAAFIEELATLQDRVAPLSEREVVQLMEQELRVPWEDVFESIESEPMAAGTIAQVHRAVLTTGERVVVKVQRPNAEAQIVEDLGLLEMFGEKAAARPGLRQVVDLPAMVEQLASSLRRELDFRIEAANIARMREILEPFSRLAVPTVRADLSSARLLVLDEIQGVPIAQAPQGEERREAARQMLEAYYQQVLNEGFFHADPHPGNLLWRDGTIYFLDFGMVGEMPARVRDQLTLLLLAFWQEDATFLGDVMIGLADAYPQQMDMESFREDLAGIIDRYRHVSLEQLRLGPLLQELTTISVRHDVRLPASLVLAGKAFGQMQLATAELDPTLDPFTVAGSFFAKRVLRSVRERASPRALYAEGEKVRLRVTRLMEALESVTGARPGPKLQIDFRGTDRLEETVRRAGRRLALAFSAGAALIATGVTVASSRVALWIPSLFGALAGVLVLGLIADLARRAR